MRPGRPSQNTKGTLSRGPSRRGEGEGGTRSSRNARGQGPKVREDLRLGRGTHTYGTGSLSWGCVDCPLCPVHAMGGVYVAKSTLELWPEHFYL